ncbi:MAG TPA: hypothetical protein VJX69_14850 [Terriglobales bacterium]|nr:hypothetical protein [Terriglobales bacterium]
MEKLEKSVLRNKSIGTKVSEDEYGQLEKLAEGRGLTLSEWLRELALTELTAHPVDEIILAEVLGLRMLFLNVVRVFGQDGEVTTEQLRKLIERIDREKQGKAAALLNGGKEAQP